jgi:hypothetical protein
MAQTSAIDQTVGEWLAETGAPSVSIAIVRGNEIYAKTYGDARLQPRVPATVGPRIETEAKRGAGWRFGAGEANADAYLTPAVLADQKAGLAPLGSVRTFILKDERERGGMAARTWKIVTTRATIEAVERTWPNAKVEQFIVTKAQ